MFDFDKISVSKLYVAPPAERVVEFSPPGIDIQNITKVLSLAVDPKTVSCMAADGYVEVAGRTNFRLTFLDREGAPKGADYNADFNVRIDGDFEAADIADAVIRVMETDVSVSDGLKLSCVLEVVAKRVRREEIEALTGAEGCYKTMRNVYVPSFIAAKTSAIPFDGEKEVGGEIGSVLSLCTSLTVTDSKVIDGGAKISSTVVAAVTYTEGEEIKQKNFEIRLEDEINLEGVSEGDTVCVDASIKNAKIVLQGVTDDNIIRLEGEAQYAIKAFRCSQIEIVDDILSLTNELTVTTSTANYSCFDGCGYFAENVAGTAMLGDNRAPAMDISALPYASCYTSKAYVDDDGKLNVEGIVITDIIYTDENGYNSVRTEVPFAISIASDNKFSNSVCVRCSVLDIGAKVRHEREIDIAMRLGVEVCGLSELTLNYISAVETGAEKPQNTSALSLYIAREGDELLDICKAFTAMPDDILAQNPNLQFPLGGGERIIYFRRG